MSPTYKVIQRDYQIHSTLYDAIVREILPGTGVSEENFFTGLTLALDKFSDRNEALLKKRDAIQAQIDAFLLERKGKEWDAGAYTAFLAQIGYLAPRGGPFKVDTQNVDPEVARTPGAQLVVPVDNARYALNAANARWGSLMDAFYGTDAGPPEANGCERGGKYNPKRGAAVFEYTHKFLDTHFSLARGAKYGDVTEFTLGDNGTRLICKLKDGRTVGLDVDSKFVGYTTQAGNKSALSSVLLMNNHLHVEIVIDRADSVGKTHAAGIKDVLLEAAISAICDLEDSVATVDAEDKALVYTNWTGLMKGTLNETFKKGGETLTRSLNKDKTFTSAKNPSGAPLVLSGRACLLVRNVGLHVYTDAVLSPVKTGSRPVPEGIVDAFVTALGALHDISSSSKKSRDLANSRTGSMYIVKPKLHGPEEVSFTVELMELVEKVLGMKENAIKLGIMDEERRTTVNLAECIRAAKSRVIFINTGFLDRTGDEIHTSFHAGPMMPKESIKKAVWRGAYEDWNVDVGIACGLVGVGQIGKGMWAAPDAMGDMLRTKGEHPRAGATTAWVPSPTAATLHAIHYHETDVLAVQARLAAAGPRAKLADILLPPLLGDRQLSAKEIQFEIENNAQGILGYIVRWIELGVGCSKVPDLHDIGLMEDRATLRISSQHIANWVHHGIVSKEQVREAFKKMALVVDRQNQGSAGYEPMGPSFNNLSFRCSLEMVERGAEIPNGLTEMTLIGYRRSEKALRKGKSKL